VETRIIFGLRIWQKVSKFSFKFQGLVSVCFRIFAQFEFQKSRKTKIKMKNEIQKVEKKLKFEFFLDFAKFI